MVEIYLKANKDYSKNGDITLDPTSCTYRDSENLLTLEHFIDDLERWKYIEYENVIAVEEGGKKKLYRIFNVVRSLYSVIAYARPLFFDLLDEVLIDVRPTLKTGQEAIDIILEGTEFKGHSNISKINTSYFIRKNKVEALLGDEENSFLNRWGGEFYCENFDVYINDRIGSDNGVRVEFGYNLNKIEENVNIEDAVTRIIPVGFNGITLEGKEPWVDSPLILKYTHSKSRVIKFEDVKVKESEEDEEGFSTIEEAREELIKRCNKLFEEGIDKPTVNYKIDMINLANTTAYKDFKMLVNVNKGDTVTCYIPHLDIDLKARVIDFERDLLTEEYISLELGNAVDNFFNKQADIQSRVDNIINKNGNVKAQNVEGTINAVRTQFKALRDIAQPQQVRAILFEDRVEGSPTFGCMCLGTMGFEIASSFKPGTQDWNFRTFGTGKGFTADLMVAGTMLADRIKGGILQSIDGSLELDLRETSKGIQFKKNGQKAIDIQGQKIKFYDWEMTTRQNPIGMIYSARSNGDENKCGVALANESDAYLSLAYYDSETDRYLPYITLDKYRLANKYDDIIVHKGVAFSEDIKMHGNIITSGNGIYLNDAKTAYIASVNRSDNDKVTFLSRDGFTFWLGDKAIFYKVTGQNKVWCDLDYTVAGNEHVNGNFTCSGTKNCVQDTNNYGKRLYYATEDCESLLTDTGKGITKVTENGTYEGVILLDTIYKESIDTSDYYVFLTKYGKGDIWIKEQTENYFIVESEYPLKFNWKVEGNRKGFESVRLEEYKEVII